MKNQNAPKGPIAAPLLQWFYQNRRELPFRKDPTPYHIWVSEIMLQQTRMTAVLPYYERFMKRLPTVKKLAECDTDTLQKLWEGLGYYSRMRNLQKAAQIICERYDGRLPADPEKLKALPGIGAYTAGAIASISFNLPAPAVDGNVLRVFARLWRDETDISLPPAKKLGEERVMREQPPQKAGDFNQALMELGALVCTPGEPHCEACPLNGLCASYGTPDAARLPLKAPKPPRRVVQVTLMPVHSSRGWLLCRRPAGGLLAGLWQVPLAEEPITKGAAVGYLASLGLSPLKEPEELAPAKHIFTHVEWHMQGWSFETEPAELPGDFVWATSEELQSKYALPGALKPVRAFMLQQGKN